MDIRLSPDANASSHAAASVPAQARSQAITWQDSVYSDGSRYFVTPEAPKLGDTVTVCLRMLPNDEVRGVKLRRIKNGSEHVDPMTPIPATGPWTVYAVTFTMNQPEIHYHFYIYTDSTVYFYNQLQLSADLPTEAADFRLVAGYEAPAWVRRSVFYQIFPDRFCNGNPDNDVQDNEYTFNGHPTVKIPWGEPAKEYDEVFSLDFYGGDLEGVARQIPYFQQLGCNALYINPIFHSATSHRYDCLDYFHVDPHLGGDQALADLSAALKAAGIRLILDVSINHTGTAHKWFNKENIFFPPSVGAYQNPESPERHYYFFGPGNEYHKWYGFETLPTLNYTSQELREILYLEANSLVKKWLKPPYAMDGWRFDVANDMARNDAIDLSHEVWREIRASIKAENPQAYLLAEQWLDCPEYLQGDQWDSAMNYFGCTRPVRQFVGEPDLFLARDPELGQLLQPLTAAQLQRRIMQHLGHMPWQLTTNQFNLLDSHDVPRLHNNPAISFGAYEIAVLMLFTLPGTPNIYYGDEVGLDGHIRNIEGCRYPMEWDPARWRHEFVRVYQTLSHLKQQSECLHDGGFKFLLADGYVSSYARFTPEEALVLVASMEKTARPVAVPIGAIGLDSSWSCMEIMGKDAIHTAGLSMDGGVLNLTIPAQCGYLFHFRPA